MINVGLTGNACSGYEKVAEIFNKLYDVPVFDADIALKFLLNFRVDIIRDIRITFGSDIYEKGVIDPKNFNTTEKFDKLVQIAQPELIKLFYSWQRDKVDIKKQYVIFKSSILFERKFEDQMDCTISVFKPKNDRAMLLSKQTGAKLSDTYSIVGAEMCELMKNSLAKWTIHNYDDLSLLTQTENINGLLLSKAVNERKLLPISTSHNYNSIINITT
jgi:dephospho-CoA kinase